MNDASNPTAPSGSDRPGAGQPPVPPGLMRVGDVERTSALQALGEHLSAGRITLDEYGDRSARVTVAKTADDLTALFDDLPAPHPVPPGATAVTGPSSLAVPPVGQGALMPPARGQAPATGDNRSTAQKLVGAAAAASVFVALALFFVTGSWYWFLLIPGISAIAGSVWGPDWKDPGSGSRGARQLRDDRRRRRQLGG